MGLEEVVTAVYFGLRLGTINLSDGSRASLNFEVSITPPYVPNASQFAHLILFFLIAKILKLEFQRELNHPSRLTSLNDCLR
jgi:hypothetical protein